MDNAIGQQPEDEGGQLSQHLQMVLALPSPPAGDRGEADAGEGPTGAAGDDEAPRLLSQTTVPSAAHTDESRRPLAIQWVTEDDGDAAEPAVPPLKEPASAAAAYAAAAASSNARGAQNPPRRPASALEELTEELRKARAIAEQRREELGKVSGELDAALKDVDVLRVQLKRDADTAAADRADFEAQLRVANSLIANLLINMNELRAHIETERKKHYDNVGRLRKEFEDVKKSGEEKNETAETILAGYKKKLKEIEDDLGEEHDARRFLEADVSDVSAGWSRADSAAAEWRAAYLKEKREKENALKKVQELEKENADLFSEKLEERKASKRTSLQLEETLKGKEDDIKVLKRANEAQQVFVSEAADWGTRARAFHAQFKLEAEEELKAAKRATAAERNRRLKAEATVSARDDAIAQLHGEATEHRHTIADLRRLLKEQEVYHNSERARFAEADDIMVQNAVETLALVGTEIERQVAVIVAFRTRHNADKIVDLEKRNNELQVKLKEARAEAGRKDAQNETETARRDELHEKELAALRSEIQLLANKANVTAETAKKEAALLRQYDDANDSNLRDITIKCTRFATERDTARADCAKACAERDAALVEAAQARKDLAEYEEGLRLRLRAGAGAQQRPRDQPGQLNVEEDPLREQARGQAAPQAVDARAQGAKAATMTREDGPRGGGAATVTATAESRENADKASGEDERRPRARAAAQAAKSSLKED